MIKELPISYSTPMILAKKEGRKTMTRRIINPQPMVMPLGAGCWYPDSESKRRKYYGTTKHFLRGMPLDFCPFGKVGDRLWVQERYQITGRGESEGTVTGLYFADGVDFNNIQLTEKEYALWSARKHPFKSTPGRFMYRSLSRFLDETTAIRVERVQEISDEDALAEGVEYETADPPFYYVPNYWPHSLTAVETDVGAAGSFRKVWKIIHGPDAWERNDWLWVLSTRKVEYV